MSSILSNLVAGLIMELRKKLSCQMDSNSQPLEPLEPLTTAAQSNRSSMTRNRHFSKSGSPEIDRPVMERDKMNAGDEC